MGSIGSIGRELVDVLSGTEHQVYITSRFIHEGEKNIHWILGNAHDTNFLSQIFYIEKLMCL